MPAFDHGMKTISQTAGRQLARMGGVSCQRWKPLESTVQTTELLSDRVFLASAHRERFVVYMEFFTEWDADAPWDLLAKAGLLSRRERLPTVTLVFILTPRGYRRQQGTFQLQCAGAPTQQLWFKEVPLWEQEPAPWWEEVPGLMALYPLYRHGRPPREAIEHAMTVIEARTTDSLQRADFLAYLQTFGRLAYPDLDVASIIGSEKMKESPFLREIMQEAAVSTCRDHIRRAIELRFGAEAANELAPPVETITDLTQLELLLDKAMICPALDDFRTALTHPRRARRRRRTGG